MRPPFVTLFISLIVLFLLMAVGVEAVSAMDPTVSQQLQGTRDLIRIVGLSGWDFMRPLLQLLAVLVIFDWLANRLGVQLKLEHLRGTLSVQTFIAGAIVTTFCVAVLADIKAVEYLKDVVLIVIGFYFGTRAKTEDEKRASVEADVENPKPSPRPASSLSEP
jgi:hypothetical protein